MLKSINTHELKTFRVHLWPGKQDTCNSRHMDCRHKVLFTFTNVCSEFLGH